MAQILVLRHVDCEPPGDYLPLLAWLEAFFGG